MHPLLLNKEVTVGSMHPATRVSTDTEYTLYCGIGDSTMQLARDRIGWRGSLGAIPFASLCLMCG